MIDHCIKLANQRFGLTVALFELAKHAQVDPDLCAHLACRRDIDGVRLLIKGKNIMKTDMKFFKFDHLPPNLQKVSAPVGDLAELMDDLIPDGPEKDAGMRKLLEAKDCLVRAYLQ